MLNGIDMSGNLSMTSRTESFFDLTSLSYKSAARASSWLIVLLSLVNWQRLEMFY